MNDVYIWSIPLSEEASGPGDACLLNDEERARAARFYFDRDSRRYTVGRATLRRILSYYIGLPPAALSFIYNPFGKPALLPEQNPNGLEFNLSHTGDHALCAVTFGHAVGLDLEAIKPLDYLQLAGSVFSPREQTILRELSVTEQPQAFFNGWTRKEAYIKAHGKGLSMPLTEFDVTLAPGEPARLLATRPDPAEANRWSLFGWSVGTDLVAALAVAGHDWQLVHRNSSELQ
ncbi:MAG TPA: 4'-phosphopantetheinyl transferase superfamily protein [Caldilineaceae bacterium]|nr:4'-phosphopantetheinyl transferase superfamily protein [Caldilineaceae bacterium]